MMLNLYYPDGTSEETRDEESSEVIESVRAAVQNDLSYSAFASEYDITTSQEDFLTDVEEGFEESGAVASKVGICIAAALGLLSLVLA